jgi:probable rRNA maturation factor
MMFQISDLFQESPDESGIQFFTEDVDFELKEKEAIRQWIEKIIAGEDKQLQLINYIFCSDAYLHELNVEYLQHDTFTDIITFQYSDLPIIEGDIFISIERVRENAQAYAPSFEHELRRVMIHGALHLCGYGDKTPEEKKLMTEKENEALGVWEE